MCYSVTNVIILILLIFNKFIVVLMLLNLIHIFQRNIQFHTGKSTLCLYVPTVKSRRKCKEKRHAFWNSIKNKSEQYNIIQQENTFQYKAAAWSKWSKSGLIYGDINLLGKTKDHTASRLSCVTLLGLLTLKPTIL